MRPILFAASTILIAGIGIASARAQAPKYVVQNRFALAGDGGWDYLTVDSASHRLFISRGTHVQVMNTQSGKLVGDISGTAGVHGIAIDSKLGRGYTSNGRENTVTVFDLKSLKEITKIKVGGNPDAIIFESTSNRVFTFNGQSSDASVIDVSTNAVIGTIRLAGKPEFPQADGAGHIFVNIEDKSEVQQINTSKLTVERSWPIAPAEGPSGMAIDTKHHRIFSVCDEAMAVSDIQAGKLSETVKIGNGPDAASFDPKWDVAFSSNGGDGTLSVVARQSSGKYANVQTLTTQKGARTMVLDPRTHQIFLIAAEFDAPAAGSRRGRMKPGSAVIIVVAPTG